MPTLFYVGNSEELFDWTNSFIRYSASRYVGSELAEDGIFIFSTEKGYVFTTEEESLLISMYEDITYTDIKQFKIEVLKLKLSL